MDRRNATTTTHSREKKKKTRRTIIIIIEGPTEPLNEIGRARINQKVGGCVTQPRIDRVGFVFISSSQAHSTVHHVACCCAEFI